MDYAEIFSLVTRIVNSENLSESEVDELIDELERSVPHPQVTDLIYHSDLSIDEIVYEAINYKPIQL